MSTTSPVLEVERIEGRDALETIRATWDKLLDQSETKTADLTPAWQLTYWDHLAATSQLFLLVVREAGEIVAIAPLKRRTTRKFGLPIRYLEFIAAGQSNYQDFIIGRRREEVLASIVEYLVLHRNQWDVLYLRHVPEHSTTARFFLEAPARQNRSVVSRVTRVQRCIYLEIEQSWEQYCAGSVKMRSKIASKQRKLQKLGDIVVYHCNTEHDYEKNLTRFFELHRLRWNNTDTPSQFNDERYCRFYRDAGFQLLSKKQLDLFMFEVDEKPIAGLLTLRYDRRCVQQLTAFDPVYAPTSPSLVMHEIFVEELFGDDVGMFDFGHYYPYKEAWASSFKNTLDIKVHLVGLAPYYEHLASNLWQALYIRIRKHQTLWKADRSVRRWLRMLSTSRKGEAGA